MTGDRHAPFCGSPGVRSPRATRPWDLHRVRDELDRAYSYQLESENAVLAQRRRTKELTDAFREDVQNDPAIPQSLKDRA